MIIYGFGEKNKKVADAGMMKCHCCHSYAAFEIRKVFKQIHIYFIPIARWNRRFYLVCTKCQAIHEIAKQEKIEIIASMRPLPSSRKVRKIWAKLDDYYKENEDSGAKLESILDGAVASLESKGYRTGDVTHVRQIFTRMLLEDKAVQAGLVRAEATDEQFDAAIARLPSA